MRFTLLEDNINVFMGGQRNPGKRNEWQRERAVKEFTGFMK